MKYEENGFKYSDMDLFKVACLEKARELKLVGIDGTEMNYESLGESAAYLRIPGGLVSSVTEELGTKALFADACAKFFGKSFYDSIAEDAAMMILNDLVSPGLLPVGLTMLLSAGHSSWFENRKRWEDLVQGWYQACRDSGCLWFGGETSVLVDVINPEAVHLAGSGIGFAPSQDNIINESRIKTGDLIILFGSSGIGANGLSLVRRIAANFPDCYTMPLSSGKTFGEAILTPTRNYVPLVRKIIEKNIDVHYFGNLTGHGYRKLMRPNAKFIYELINLFIPQPEFSLIQEYGIVSDSEAYSTFNMGCGYFAYVPRESVANIMTIASELEIKALVAGKITESDVKRVILPNGVIYEEKDLQIR